MSANGSGWLTRRESVRQQAILGARWYQNLACYDDQTTTDALMAHKAYKGGQTSETTASAAAAAAATTTTASSSTQHSNPGTRRARGIGTGYNSSREHRRATTPTMVEENCWGALFLGLWLETQAKPPTKAAVSITETIG